MKKLIILISFCFAGLPSFAVELQCHKPELFEQMYFTEIDDPQMLAYEQGVQQRAEKNRLDYGAGKTNKLYYPRREFLHPSELPEMPELMQDPEDDMIVVRYDRDIHLKQWDKVPLQQAHQERFDLLSDDQHRDIDKMPLPGGGFVRTYEAGDPQNASFGYIFVHGDGNSKELGKTDVKFGGNFNNLKQTVIRSGGVYYAPSFQGIGGQGIRTEFNDVEIACQLMKKIYDENSGARTVLGCGSAGGKVCRGIAQHPTCSQYLAGTIFQEAGSGSHPEKLLANSEAQSRYIPQSVFVGSYDGFPSKLSGAMRSYRGIKELSPDYPVRFQLVHGGVHGTSMRIADYCEQLTWIFNNQETEVMN